MSDYLDKLEDNVDNNETKIPTPEDFFLKTNLYDSFDIDKNNENDIERVLEIELFDGAISCYCKECNEKRTFRNDLIEKNIASVTSYSKLKEYKNPSLFKDYISSASSQLNQLIKERTFTIEFYCTHNHDHRIYFTFTIQNCSIQKSGQFPSLLDLEDSKEINKYKKELGKEEGQNYYKAIGLASHGIGAGSYVYLRRIFERFIYEAKNKAIEEGRIIENDFVSKKMNERIELLKNYLPDILVEHKEYYSVVSKGIHELSEYECLEHFNILKMGIEVILDEKIELRKKQEKRNAFKVGINETHKKVK
ncbi:hypothetical protein ACOTVQ_09650 [Aliarcobacter butzleri]|uniref:hypothetical protein n=1 Tax=Aliarcobacter butzleri TaxID=28197 RepID=UPI0021B1FEC8|nr:hypothetical protein [Aliarcobacter butzleri]MCT7626788.1 hypothetical protein [Aliarcobacter butzleri]